MDKVERLISIIMILLKKEIVSATEFAQLFQVSKRTILRDMETLSLSNIPVYSVSGVNGGFGILKEYKVDKRLLSNADLENILTALNGLESVLLSEEVERTIRKIEAMVSPSPLNRSIRLSFYDWEGRAEMAPVLKACQESILRKRRLSFDYMDKNGAATKRTVEPYALHFSESSWYLRGYCLQRESYRTFKLSRIDRLIMEEQTFVPREDAMDPRRDAADQPELVVVKALIAPAVQDRFIERYGRKCIESDPSGYLRVTAPLPQNRIGFQFLAGFGTDLKLIGPEPYARDFRRFLRQMVSNYEAKFPQP